MAAGAIPLAVLAAVDCEADYNLVSKIVCERTLSHFDFGASGSALGGALAVAEVLSMRDERACCRVSSSLSSHQYEERELPVCDLPVVERPDLDNTDERSEDSSVRGCPLNARGM